ncbi:MAG: type III-A CRISPR-associated RAMP protein Csm3 [Armatimonadetes bacterium]|nr:type III-A CRISPR-associated RAMP protein Csm3 [Armatimonadota bacterium]
MRLIRYKNVTGKIVLHTGLHIGGSQETTQIGGVDNPVIRQPIDNMPFIPGSSLKGKMRSLLELLLDKVEVGDRTDGKAHRYRKGACDSEPCPICYIFGASADNGAPIGPARLVVRDCMIDRDHADVKKLLENSFGLPLSEDKAEVGINRITSASEGSLRKTERVPAGAVFNLDITYRVFDDGDGGKKDEELFEYVRKGLALVEKDTLGGSGSRGYGKVRFEDLKVDGVETSLPEV